MQFTKLSTLLVVVATLSVADAGQSSSHVTGPVRLMDFDPDTDEVLGYPHDQPPLGWYIRSEVTQHVPGLLDPKAPPNPCNGLARAWNRVVAATPIDQRRGAVTALLGRLADKQCEVIISRDVNSDPQPIISIAPTGR